MASVSNQGSACPTSCSLDLLSDKWSLLIIKDMVLVQKRYFKKFLQSDEKTATNILTIRLARLEMLGIISKLKGPESERQVIYDLTGKGIDLTPLPVELLYWGSIHLGAPDADPEVIKKIRSNKP